MFIGTLGAINQNRIKRLFAYSSIAHVGYLLIALATGTIEAVESLLLYIIVYILMIINVFGVILVMSRRKEDRALQTSTTYIYKWETELQSATLPKISSITRIKKKDECVKYITDLCNISKTNPVLAVTMAAILFSNAGIPPLAGFYGKLNVFLAAVEGSMYFIAFAAVICSVMGAFYSIRLVKIIYFHREATRQH